MSTAARARRTETATTGRRRDRGSSLLEVMIVLVIIGLVATIATPRLLGYLDRAKVDTARAQVRNLSALLDLYRLDVGAMPSASEGLGALVDPPPGVEAWRGPYLKARASLLDPWDRPYRYEVAEDRRSARISSLGADGEEGGSGLDADIVE